MTVAAADHARVAYDAFAPSYDRFTAHHDQEAWTGLVLDLAIEAGLTGRRLLEVGCGTASAMLPMLDRGFEVSGTDISPAMVAVAREKVEGRARVDVADMRRMPVLGEYDLVWAMCDAVNCLLDEDELAAAFGGMSRNLAPGGVVAFDVSSLSTLRRFYSSIAVVPGESEVVIFRGMSSPDLPAGGVVEARLEHLRERPDGWDCSAFVHRQRHHDEATLRAALLAAGLEAVTVQGFDIRGAGEPFDDLRSNKAVYIARTRASGGEGR